MKPTTAIALSAILIALIVTMGASVTSQREDERLGTFCPSGSPCDHSMTAPSSLRDTLADWRAGADLFMADRERALMSRFGLPEFDLN